MSDDVVKLGHLSANGAIVHDDDDTLGWIPLNSKMLPIIAVRVGAPGTDIGTWVPALIDTGANCCGIDPSVAKTLNVCETGTGTMRGASDIPRDVALYVVDLILPQTVPGRRAAGFRAVHVSAQTVSGGDADTGEIGAVIGMDLLIASGFAFRLEAQRLRFRLEAL